MAVKSDFFGSDLRQALSRRATLRTAVIALMLAGAAALGACGVPAGPAVAQETRPLEDLTVVTATGRHAFKVEVMRKQEELSRGLMYRRTMARDHGMLFDFGEVRPVAMWMRNTYLPLDMLFIDARGRVVNVAENTEPLSEETIPSAAPVLSVLEVNAGTARRIGLKAGDRVEHPLFAGK
ncbi:MAG: DUF192 domain-containing protein [Beijerinckiaceae bacterium]